MSKTKKLIIGISAAVIGLTSAFSASALEWKIKGYDTSRLEKEAHDTYRIGIVYEQYENNGYATLPTGIVADASTAAAYGLKPYARATFSAPAFELAWPNREYVRVYADGVDTGKVLYNGVKENLTYRKANYMWELAAPHRIFRRTQAFINGSWYTDDTYPVEYAGDVAKVTAEYDNYYGFGYWHKYGSNIHYMPTVDYGPAYNHYGYVDTDPKRDFQSANLKKYAPNLDENIYLADEQGNWTTNAIVIADALKPGAVTDLTNYYIPADRVKVKKTFSLELAGPMFEKDGSVNAGKEYADVYSAALVADIAVMLKDGKPVILDPVETLANYAVPELVKHVYTYDGTTAVCDTEWVLGGFELAAPYRYYEYLVVDGVVLDGSLDVSGIVKPKVYRYVGTANVTAVYSSSSVLSNPAYYWNEKVQKFEFLVDTTVTETLYYNGNFFKSRVVEVILNDPSEVFGQIDYRETWEWRNGINQKVIKAVLKGTALDGTYYETPFEGDNKIPVGWGAHDDGSKVVVDNLDELLDPNHLTIDGITYNIPYATNPNWNKVDADGYWYVVRP